MMENVQVGLRALRIVRLALSLAVAGTACQPLPDEIDFEFEFAEQAGKPDRPLETRLLLELLAVCVVEDPLAGVDPCGELPSDFDFAWDPQAVVEEAPGEGDPPDTEFGDGWEPDADLELLLLLLEGEAE